MTDRTRTATNSTNELPAAQLAASAAVLGGLLYLLVAFPVLAWSTLRGDPKLIGFGTAVGGGIRWLAAGLHGEPRQVAAWRTYRHVMPPREAWFVLDVIFVVAVAAAAVLVWMRVDRWRSRRWVARPSWDPRRHVTPRSWATPRDMLHLQHERRLDTAALRLAYRDQRRPELGDSWPLGYLRRKGLRSAPELHLAVVAPTRAGKSTRVVIPSAREHPGPAVILSNKTDVVRDTVEARSERGPVWIFAPMSDANEMPLTPCGWTPLRGCESWERALLMGRWMYDADPTASAVAEHSGGARFYGSEAVGVLLPPLLHAAALAGRGMGDVLRWLRSGVDGLDAPREVLIQHDALAAADQLIGAQALDERPRSFLLMSAAQLIDAYRFPQVQQADRDEFDPESLLAGGTLYLIAPESEQEALAPVFAGVLGAILREWERAAATGSTPPLLKILADEAAHLAPLAKLPTYLAVSGGWGVRWCLVYQSLAQLEQRYGRDADAILANTLAKLFLGPLHDESTRRYLCALLDEEPSTTVSRSSSGFGAGVSTTHHERPVPKVSAQPLMQLAPGEAIAIHGRDLPAFTYLPASWERRGRRRW